MKSPLLSLLLITGLSACQAPEQTSEIQEQPKTSETSKEMLLLGTFHFNNPGRDIVKTKSFDILSDTAQGQLDELCLRVKDFGPSKIFVEWDWEDQAALDSLYGLYRAGSYFSDTTLSSFYRKNEIVQLAFRAADLLDHERVYAIDYLESSFPFDSMMQDIEQAGQEGLQAELDEMMETFTAEFDDMIMEGKSLCEIYVYMNAVEMRELDRSFYTGMATRAGAKGKFTGAYLAAEWYRRNLYMWSTMLKGIDGDDERVMALMGAGHASVFSHFLENEPDWQAADLQEVLCP